MSVEATHMARSRIPTPKVYSLQFDSKHLNVVAGSPLSFQRPRPVTPVEDLSLDKSDEQELLNRTMEDITDSHELEDMKITEEVLRVELKRIRSELESTKEELATAKEAIARASAEHTEALIRANADSRRIAIESVKQAVDLALESSENTALQDRERLEKKMQRLQSNLDKENEALKRELADARDSANLIAQRMQEEKFEQMKILQANIRIQRTLEKLQSRVFDEYYFDAIESL